MEPTLYLAFNKSVQTEAQRRFPGHVRCQTIHALAYGAIRPKGTLKGFISFFDVARMLGCGLEMAVDVVATVEAYQQSAAFEITADLCPFRFEDASEDRQLRQWYAQQATVVHKALVSGTLPMTHGTYLKEYQLRRPVINTSTILLDEAQDTNPVILDVIRRQRNRCKIISVGDKFQAIYAFTGAVNAMESLHGDAYFLTRSFRFGPRLAEAANRFLEHFYEMPRPLQGLEGLPTQVLTMEQVAVGTKVPKPYTHIFRSNAGLFDAALDYAISATPIALTGGQTFQTFMDDLMDLFQVFIDQPERCSHPTYRVFKTWKALRDWADRRDDVNLGNRMDIVEKHERELPKRIQRILAACVPDDMAQVLLVTAHRAKGMQWDHVKVADDFAGLTDEHGQPLEPVDRKLKTEEDMFTKIHSNEVNLVYVAITRAIKCVAPGKSYFDVIHRRPNERLRSLRAAKRDNDHHQNKNERDNTDEDDEY